MSHSKSPSMTLNDTEKSSGGGRTGACQERTADKNAENGSEQCNSSHEGKRERVLKEVGLTSSAFIGPAVPPQANTSAKSDIEDSLSEFYKELERIDPPDGANGNPGKHDAGCLPPQKIPPSRDPPHGVKNVNKRNCVETDGYQDNIGRKQPRPHWYENEPYHNPRRRPGLEPDPTGAASDPNQWRYPQPPNGPPNLRFHRPPIPHKPPPSAFLDPQTPRLHMNPSFHSPGTTNQSRDKLHSSSFSGFPPRDVSSHASWDSCEDFPHRRDQQSCSYDPHSDNGPVGPPQHRNEEKFHLDVDYRQIQRYDAYDEVWERSHDYETHDDAHLDHSARVLILMRGLPGSGKSTRARELLSMGPNGVILSTDDYFALGNGYRYEAGLLGVAHEWNQHRANDAAREGRSPIIIDNTNLQAWEMKPYVRMALDRGYKVDFCEPLTSWKFDPHELERRNKHGVPHDKIAHMLDRFSFPVSVDIVLSSQEPPHVNQRRQQEQPQTARRTQDFR